MYSDSAVSISIQKPEQSTSEQDTIRLLLDGLFQGIVIQVNTDPLSLNLYTYCCNNPIFLIDPSGNKYIPEWAQEWNSSYNIYNYDVSNPAEYLPPTSIEAMPQDVYMEYPDQYGPYPALKDYYNDDGTYSLYDDQRGKIYDGPFHSQVFAYEQESSPVLGYSPDSNSWGLSAGKHSFSAMTGGWEWEHFELSLFDMGTAEAAAGVSTDGIEASAMVSFWSPSATLKLGDLDITLGLNWMAAGATLTASKKGVKVGVADVFGVNLELRW